MAVDMFLKLSAIKGESKDVKHKDEIDVLSWSWGMSQSGTAHMGGGAGAGKVAVQDLNFTHYIDKSSPTLMLHCCNGKHIKSAMLTRPQGGRETAGVSDGRVGRHPDQPRLDRRLARRGPPDRERHAQLRQGEGRVSGAEA